MSDKSNMCSTNQVVVMTRVNRDRFWAFLQQKGSQLFLPERDNTADVTEI